MPAPAPAAGTGAPGPGPQALPVWHSAAAASLPGLLGRAPGRVASESGRAQCPAAAPAAAAGELSDLPPPLGSHICSGGVTEWRRHGVTPGRSVTVRLGLGLGVTAGCQWYFKLLGYYYPTVTGQ